MKSKGFTLIELLIVVAIIAILAAIAVPNFLEAQTRAKVTRIKSDMRTAATGLESYYIDHNVYPYDGYNFNPASVPNGGGGGGHVLFNYWYLPYHLSTPIAYLSNARLPDPFRSHLSDPAHWQIGDVRYTNQESTWGIKYDPWQTASGASTYRAATAHEFGGWYMRGVGPDKVANPNPAATEGGWPGISTGAPYNYPQGSLPNPYDPTNGTVSRGDILRSQKSATGYVNAQ